MFKKSLYWLLFSTIALQYVAAQQANIELLGRWAKGPSLAVFKRGDFVFAGNGSYLEVYKNRGGDYARQDAIVLPATVRDIWVQGDTTHVYAACGTAGLQVVYFDYSTRKFDSIIGQYDTPGFATGLMQYGSHVFLADGDAGFRIFNIDLPSSPQPKGVYNINGFYAHDVWIYNPFHALVAGGEAGLFSFNITNVNQIVKQDSVVFPKFDISKPAPFTQHLYIADTIAYVASGWGGMRIVDVSDPTDIKNKELGYWPHGGVAQEVLDVWVDSIYAFFTTGGGVLHTHINVSDPENLDDIAPHTFSMNSLANAIVVEHDTAYIASGTNGHLLLDVNINNAPNVLESFPGGGYPSDVDIYGNYACMVSGESGFSVFSLNIPAPPVESLSPVGTYNTDGEARQLRVYGNRAYIADGSKDLLTLDISVINSPFMVSDATQDFDVTDACDAIDVNGDYIFLGYRDKGIAILNRSNIYDPVFASPISTMNDADRILVHQNRLFVVKTPALYVYDITDLPSHVDLLKTFNDANMDVRSVRATEDSIYVANGMYGLLILDQNLNEIRRKTTQDTCNDIRVDGKNLFTAESEAGISIYTITSRDSIVRRAFYNTGGSAAQLNINNTGSKIAVLDDLNGLHLLSNEIKPGIAVDVDTIDFGPVPYTYTRTFRVQITNTGTAALSVDSIQIAGNASASTFQFSDTRFSVIPGDYANLYITFQPSISDPLNIEAKAVLASNAGTAEIALLGSATTYDNEGPYITDIFTEGLYHLNEGDGVLIASDTSANSRWGNVNGAPARTTSKSGFNRAIVFDGINDWVQIPGIPAHNFHNTPFTVECFFNLSDKPEPGTKYVLIKRGSTQSQFELSISAEAGKQGLLGRIWRDGDKPEPVEIHTGSLAELANYYWYHTALTWDGDSLYLYLNGFVVASTAYSGKLRNVETTSIGIGSNLDVSSPFKGMIDEVRISSIARQDWEFNVNRSRILVNVDTLDFGDVIKEKSRTLSFQVKNDGIQSLAVTNVSLSPELSTLKLSQPGSFNLQSGASRTISVTFSPNSEISLNENQIIIESNDVTYPRKYITLLGRSVESLSPGAYTSDAFTSGLYHFDQAGPDNVVEDASSSDMDGTMKYGAQLSDTTYRKFNAGRSLACPGQNGIFHIRTDASDPLYSKWGGFTIETWFLPTALPVGQNQAVLVQRGHVSDFQFRLMVNSQGRLQGQVRDNEGEVFNVTSGDNAIELQQWYHAALIISDSISLYINRQRIHYATWSGEMQGSDHLQSQDTLSIYVGNYFDGESSFPFQGYIDELRLSNIDRQPWELNVVDARMALSTTAISFGSVLEGESRERSFVISNKGSNALDILRIESADPDPFYVGAIEPFTLENDTSLREIIVTFTPLASGTFNSFITVRSTDPFVPDRVIQVSGTGVEQTDSGQYVRDEYTYALFHFDSDSLDLNNFDHRYATWSDSGRFGEALQIDRGGYLQFPMHNSFNLNQTPLSVESWIKFHEISDTVATLFRWGSGETNTIEFRFDGRYGLIAYLLSSDGTLDTLHAISFPEIQNRLWYHLALTWDGTHFRFYLNNHLKSTRLYSRTLVLNQAYPVFMGAADANGKYPFAGLFDELRISTIARKTWEFSVLPPDIWVYPSELNFSQVVNGQSRTLYFQIKNQGDQALQIPAIVPRNSAFTFAPDTGFSLARLQSKTLGVTFKPAVSDTTYESHLAIFSNDSTQDSSIVNLSGTSVRIQRFSSFQDDAPNTLALYHFDREENDSLGVSRYLIDYSGSGRTGEIYGAWWREAGLFGSDALLFEGNLNRVHIKSHEDLEFNMYSDQFTIELSFRTDTLAGIQALLSKGVNDTVSYQILLNRYGQLMIPGFDTTAQSFTDGFWHQLAFLYHPQGTSKLYVDGELVGSRLNFRFQNIDLKRPLLLGVAESFRNYYQYSFYGYLDELRISDVLRSEWEISLQDYGIRIDHLTPAIPTIGEEMRIFIEIPRSFNPHAINFYYRKSGDVLFYQLEADNPGLLKEVVIPNGHVTSQGLEYYIEVMDGGYAYTYPMVEPQLNPASLSMQFSSMPAEWEFYNQEVQSQINQAVRIQKTGFISIPYEMNAPYMDSIFQQMMPYDPYLWRLFWWHPVNSGNALFYNKDTLYYDYAKFASDSNISSFDPGRAFWLVLDKEKTLTLNAGKTVATDTVFYVDLKAGWNMVGCPYGFPVKWKDCYNSSSQYINNIVGWSRDGYVYNALEFEPWQGYWIHNPDDVEARLFIPSIASNAIGAAKKRLDHKNLLSEDEWSLHLQLSGQHFHDQFNYLGVRQEAELTRDRFDIVQAPPMGDGAQLYFDHRDWELYPEIYTADFRPSGQEGYVWEISAASSMQEKSGLLRWQFENSLPACFEAYLFDLGQKVAVNLKSVSQTNINLNESTAFRIVVGTPEFIKNNSDGISLQPIAFHMDQNYPNPFNPVTTIQYSIPKRSEVTLMVYNILGQHVCTLMDGFQDPGYYDLAWYGLDKQGIPVASGVYIYRLKMEDQVRVKKMVLVR